MANRKGRRRRTAGERVGAKPKMAGMATWWALRYLLNNVPPPKQVDLLDTLDPVARLDRKAFVLALLQKFAETDQVIETAAAGSWLVSDVKEGDGYVTFGLSKTHRPTNVGIQKQGKFESFRRMETRVEVVVLPDREQQWVFCKHDGRAARSAKTFKLVLESMLNLGVVRLRQSRYYDPEVILRTEPAEFSKWRSTVKTVEEVHFRYRENLPIGVSDDKLNQIETLASKFNAIVPGHEVVTTIKKPSLSEELIGDLDKFGSRARMKFGAVGRTATNRRVPFESDHPKAAKPAIVPEEIGVAELVKLLKLDLESEVELKADGADADG